MRKFAIYIKKKKNRKPQPTTAEKMMHKMHDSRPEKKHHSYELFRKMLRKNINNI